MPMCKENGVNMIGTPDGTTMLDQIWCVDHEETVAEGQELLQEFVEKAEARGIAPIVIVPPVYLKSVNRVSLGAFQAKRKKFYEVLDAVKSKDEKIKVFDYADAFTDRKEYFRTVTNLNVKGRLAFTDLINRDLLKKIQI